MHLDENFFREEIRCGYKVSEKMKKVWAVELNLLEQFDKLCRENNLQYFVDSGTLLGAVRHQGFIPWDDDIDVVMFRDDYEKLKIIAKDAVSSPYFYQNSYNDLMIWAFSKLRDSRTTAIEFPDFPQEFHQGIFIDIFPLDDVPDGERMKPVIGRMQREIWMSVADPEGLKKLIDQGQSMAMGAEVLMELLKMQVRERLDVFEQFNLSQFGKSSEVCFITDYFLEIPSVKREWYSEVVYLPFENMMVPAPAEYEKYLKCRYGDYMAPVQAPNMHDGIFLDPETPYTKYINKL